MDIQKFVLDYNIVGIAMGTIVGFGLTNWTKELRKSVIQPYFIEKFGVSKYGDFASATVEVLVLIGLLFLMYQYLVRPAVSGALEEKENEAEEEKEWKENLIKNMNDIEKRVRGINNSNQDISEDIQDLNRREMRRDRKKNQVSPLIAQPGTAI